MTDKKTSTKKIPAKKSIKKTTRKPAAKPVTKAKAPVKSAKTVKKSPIVKPKKIPAKKNNLDKDGKPKVRPDIATRFQPGNQLWRQVTNPGRPRILKTPEELWKKAKEYFEWADSALFEEVKLFSSQGEVIKGEIEKLRPYTMAGLTVFIGLSESSWYDYKDKPEFSVVCKLIDRIIFEQKLYGASAGLMNPVIIARELGLSDKKEVDVPKDGGLSELMQIISGNGLRPTEDPDAKE